MRAFTIRLTVSIAFAIQAFEVHYLPLPPGAKLLVAVIYGGVVGWGITRWKSRRA